MSTGSFTAISASWSLIKSFVDKGTNLQYFEDDELYSVRTQNGSIIYECELYKAGADIDNIPADNATNLADFEDNYKADANDIERLKVKAEFEADQQLDVNIQGQALTNSLRYDQMTSNQSISKTSLTEVYSYSGTGSFYGAYIELTNGDMELTVTIDGVKILDAMPLADLPSGGPGNSGGSVGVSAFIKKQSDNQINIEPPMAITYSSSLKVELKSNKNNKKLSFGYVVLTKES